MEYMIELTEGQEAALAKCAEAFGWTPQRTVTNMFGFTMDMLLQMLADPEVIEMFHTQQFTGSVDQFTDRMIDRMPALLEKHGMGVKDEPGPG